MFSVLPALGYKLFMNIVDDWRQEDCYAFQNNPSGVYGSPKGNLPSQWIGLVYLNEIDWYIASRPDCEDSTRYMDDGICFFHLKSSCKDCKIKIEKMLKDKDMGVRLHPKKTRYAPVSQGFTFCGWRYTMSNDGRIKTRLKTERKAVTKRRMKKMTYDYYRGTIGLDKVRQRVNGMDAFFRQGDTKQFKRYLSYRFMFTRDEDKYFKDYSYRFRKNKSRKKEDKVNEKEKKVGFDG
jgi:hypothetical protein